MELKSADDVKNIPKQASRFWPSFSRQVLMIIILSQIFITFLIGLIAIQFNVLQIDDVMLWIILVILFSCSLLINIFIFKFATRPTKDLIAAVVHVSGELSSLTPPNPNSRRNEQSGLKDALLTIYELSGENKQTETNSTQNNNTLSDGLDTTICGFIIMNSDGQIIYANNAAPIKVNAEGTQELKLLFNGRDNLDFWINQCRENAVHAEHTWTRIPDRLPDEEGRRFFDIIASYQKGKEAEIVLALVDRTSTYIVDEENLDFLAFAAHELRGPITVIRGYLDVLEDELSPVFKGDQHELFRRLVISSNRLSGYINNILNTSRYDRRHLKIYPTEETVEAIYDILSDDMKLRAGAQNRLLTVNIPPNLPTIAADKSSISEVIGNLIDNAIKYSNEGGSIIVSAAVDNSGDYVNISVEDHGIGMPDNVVSNLFQKFYRSHRSRESVSGTGIGLYISKAIVESHGGTISVRSEDGKGSTFIVSLPIYAKVADKLQKSNNSNEGLINEGRGWIKNHSMYRG